MLRLIIAAVNRLLGFFDLTVHKKSRLKAIEWDRKALAELYRETTCRRTGAAPFPAECIVFSKDRALQLHALLSSYRDNVVSPVPVHILYYASNEHHQKAYDQVQALFPETAISFCKQKEADSFRDDLLALLAALQAEKVFFLVDDIIFTETVDLQDFTAFDTARFVPSLRLGLNLQRCYTMLQQQPLPAFASGVIDAGDKFCWKWSEGGLDWGYPLSVDGHFFSSHEITAMAKLIPFRAPNTFEANLQKFLNLFLSRYGISYNKSKILNIPCNKVQQENENICGTIDHEYLLRQWQQGFQLDYQKLQGFLNESAHQEVEITLTKRHDKPS
ncbi:hypothetical protein ACFL43_02685 [Thermodesulfobacteriota bacterium]